VPFHSGGKGTVRRKVVRKTKPSAAQDDKKLQGALKKLNVQPIAGVEEVNMFREDGNVLHFTAPKGKRLLLRLRWPIVRNQMHLLKIIYHSPCRSSGQHIRDLWYGPCQGAY